MPELPEVEIIKRGLNERLPGRTISRVLVREPRVIVGNPAELVENLRARTILGLKRRGKYLIIRLDHGALLIHLRMTGQLTFWDPKREVDQSFHVHPATGLQRIAQHEVDRHTHFVLRFTDGTGVHYRDVRKFGRIRLLLNGLLEAAPELLSLGMEPFSESWRLESFERLIKSRRSPIKVVLLNQRLIAGLGNIYADESLFEARLRPTWQAGSLGGAERRRLFSAIEPVLERAIHHGGTTLRDFIDSSGKRGSNQERLYVYGRGGQPCHCCGTLINRIVLAQRSTHFCRTCQSRRR